MKKFSIVLILAAIIFSLFGCGIQTGKLPVSVLIVPHFEIGEMSDDDPGEAQLFFEEYLKGCDEYAASDGTVLYYNPENKVAMYLTGVGKINASMSTTAVLSDPRFDYSEAFILAVGCSGGSVGYATLGDVVIESAVCDYDIGHTADIRETEGSGIVWFSSPENNEIGCRMFDPDTVSRAFALTENIRLETSSVGRSMLSRNFPGEQWAMRDPAVIKGTSVTSDNYWKGRYNHEKALRVTEYYECPDPYASTEMEDMAIASVADRFGMLNRTLVMRVAVNIDMFYDDATPESLWSSERGFVDAATDNNDETLDIFGPGMENLFRAGRKIVDSVLSGEF